MTPPLPAKNTTNPTPIDEHLMISVYLMLFFNTLVLFGDQSSGHSKVAMMNLTLLSLMVEQHCFLISLGKTNFKPVQALWLSLKAWFFLTAVFVGAINMYLLPPKVKFAMYAVTVFVSSVMFCFIVTYGVVKIWKYREDEPENQTSVA